MKVDQARLFEAVCSICPDVVLRAAPRDIWRRLDEDDLWFELVACILGSQVRFELAQRAADGLRRDGLADAGRVPVRREQYESRIAKCLSGLGYRFPTSRAKQILQTQDVIYNGGQTLRSIVENSMDAHRVREKLVADADGIGPKQASLFLRNIGFSVDIAILDVHVLRYMAMMGLKEPCIEMITSKLAHYEQIETVLRGHAAHAGYALGHMDLAIWIVMRTISHDRHSDSSFRRARFGGGGRAGSGRRA